MIYTFYIQKKKLKPKTHFCDMYRNCPNSLFCNKIKQFAIIISGIYRTRTYFCAASLGLQTDTP